jgi:translation initiation factor IF-1
MTLVGFTLTIGHFFDSFLFMKNNKRKKSFSVADEQRDDKLEMEGVVEEVCPAGTFRVLVGGGHQVLAHLSGKMRKFTIRVTKGDHVRVECSPYDLSKGRITFRSR